MTENQCRNVFRLDRPDCRACAGHNRNCPGYSPKRETKRAAERLTQGRGTAHHGAPQEAAARFESGVPENP